MKNLFLSCAMLMIFGTAVAVAEETPKKTTQKTDTITKKKSTKGTKHSSTHKTDTVNKQQMNKKKSSTTTTPRKDSTATRP